MSTASRRLVLPFCLLGAGPARACYTPTAVDVHVIGLVGLLIPAIIVYVVPAWVTIAFTKDASTRRRGVLAQARIAARFVVLCLLGLATTAALDSQFERPGLHSTRSRDHGRSPPWTRQGATSTVFLFLVVQPFVLAPALEAIHRLVRRSPGARPAVPRPEPGVRLDEMCRSTEACCPVCRDPVPDGAATCPECQVAYHSDCLAFSRGCAMYGCPGALPEASPGGGGGHCGHCGPHGP